MKKNWLSFTKARKIVRGLGLKKRAEWRRYDKQELYKINVPHAPEMVYPKEWNGMGDWLGTGNKRGFQDRDYLPFKEARDFVRGLGLVNENEWRKYIIGKSHISRIPKIPIAPRCVYEKEWESMGDWLGNGKGINHKQYFVNENFFKKWSHNMAYVFGLWFADGSIVKTKTGGRVFDITLDKKDKYLLDNISKVMKSSYPIHKNRNCFRIQFSSKEIIKDIIGLGGKYRKSLDCNFPYVPKKYLPDFIRGEFDGDGCIYCCNKNGAYYASIRSGSKLFSQSTIYALKKAIPNFKGNIYKSTYKLQNGEIGLCYSIMFNTNDTRRLRNFMYQNNPQLKMLRKYNLFQKAGQLTTLSRNSSEQNVSA